MQTTHLLSICSRAAPQRQLFRNHFSVMPQFPRTPPKALPLPPCPAPLHVQPQVLSHLAVSAPPTRLTPELPVPSAGACQQRQNILGKAPRGHCKACPGPGGRPAGQTDGRAAEPLAASAARRALQGGAAGLGSFCGACPARPRPRPLSLLVLSAHLRGWHRRLPCPGLLDVSGRGAAAGLGASGTGGHGRQRGRGFRYLPPSRERLTGDVLGAGLRGSRRGSSRPGPRGAHRQQPQPARGRAGAVLPSPPPR